MGKTLYNVYSRDHSNANDDCKKKMSTNRLGRISGIAFAGFNQAGADFWRLDSAADGVFVGKFNCYNRHSPPDLASDHVLPNFAYQSFKRARHGAKVKRCSNNN